MDYAGWELERQRAALAALLLGEAEEESSLRSPGGGRQEQGAAWAGGGRQAGTLRTPAAEGEAAGLTAVRRAEGGWFSLRTESGTGGGGTGAPPTETAENGTARNGTARNGRAEKGTAGSGTETGQAVLLRLEEFGPETPGDVRFFAAGLRSSAGPREAEEQWLSPVLRAEEGRLSGGGAAEREAARAISLAVQRDARRYDGGFTIY